MLADTADATHERAPGETSPHPALIVVFSATSAMSLALPLDGAPREIGRAGEIGSLLPDSRLSRSHCSIGWEPDGWVIRDLASRNGTFVDGEAIRGEIKVERPRTIRVADTILVPCPDVTTFRPTKSEGGWILGWRMQEALAAVAAAARGSQTLLVQGESGTGKELAAHTFHERGPNANGPFVAINCATVPKGIAERLLFGARKGAYSGAATDTIGHVRSADRGVLFLDEAAELDLEVQAKLLRVFETGELIALGATQATRVALRVCIASHVPLRQAVSEGRFRADLYHRITPPEVALVPLRDRPEEIAHHVVEELGVASKLAPQARLVEECMLRPWPGNVRELRRHLREAASRAREEGADRVRLDHLAKDAGTALEEPSPEAGEPAGPRPYVHHAAALTREDLERALADNGQNVARAARSLGLHRTQMYRELERVGLGRPAQRR